MSSSANEKVIVDGTTIKMRESGEIYVNLDNSPTAFTGIVSAGTFAAPYFVVQQNGWIVTFDTVTGIQYNIIVENGILKIVEG